MALIVCTVYSKILQKETEIIVYLPFGGSREAVVLPDETRFDSNRKYKTLTLLHGYSGNQKDWSRKTRMELFAEEKNLAVICPDGNNGHYTDWYIGPQYLSFLEYEIMPMVQSLFPLSKKREDNYLAGLSMGGYGALKWGLTYPERFSHLISLSGGVDILPRIEHYASIYGKEAVEAIFGSFDQIADSNHNIFNLLIKLASSRPELLPRIYTAAGLEDIPGLTAHHKLVNCMKGIHCDYTDSITEGKHDFRFWDMQLEKVIMEWLPV